MEPSARRLYRSLDRLSEIPEFAQVWPGHGAGSACGKALGAVPTSTIGYEDRFNPALLAASNEDAFVEFILAGQPEPPLYFANMKRDNKMGPPILGSLPMPARMTASELGALDAHAVAVIDTRAWDDFRAGHVPGSLSIPLTRSFNTNAGSFVRDTDDIYLIVAPDRVEEAVRDLVRIGLDGVKGWFSAGEVAGVDPGAVALERSAQVEPGDLIASLERASARVLDVRRATEYAKEHIPGAINIAHTRLASRLDEVPRDTPLVVHCLSGARSACAASYLEREGYDVANLAGGIAAWKSTENAPVQSQEQHWSHDP